MRNPFLYLFAALLGLAAGAQIAQSQSSADQNRGRNRPLLDGGVESVDGRLQVSLSNIDNVHEFRGAARISLGASGQQSEKLEFTLAPQESRLFPLGSRGAPGDNYTLAIYGQGGALIFIKNAPVKRGIVAAPIVTAPAPIDPTPAPTDSTGAKDSTDVKELTVKARLVATARSPSKVNDTKSRAAQQPSPPQSDQTVAPTPEETGDPQVAKIKKPSAKLARRGQTAGIKSPALEHQIILQELKSPGAIEKSPPAIEVPISEEPGPLALIFEIASPEPLINANLSVNADVFKQRQAVTVRGRADVQFQLPDDFDEPKINYTLTDASGRTLAQGELMFESLKQADSVSLSDIKTDKETYDPGESANFVVTLEGVSPSGYLLEVTAKDPNTQTLLKDSRQGVYSKGKAIQEFKVEIPADAKGGIVTVEFKAFGVMTRKLFGYIVREIFINDTESEKVDKSR
ncbi:MAG TPA: hypothetical protein VJ810_00655 [Blastocatellia bacterium]|nr:hypothetical protein [Blastocatellia bacterium]